MSDLIICDMGAKRHKKVINCPVCKAKRKADVIEYFDYVAATCSKGHELRAGL